ncbi:MAG: hypothetical protein JWM68_5498 [Verrucomicrobiales bacterium]|nr:hypothetical protein [Verrucomicrobiales bacterium]
MKNILLAVLGVVLLAGCSTGYVITLNNRSQIATKSKPVFKDGAYVYKDGQGKEQFVSAVRVKEISPASMVEKNKFNGH